ncbi:hypothetical protein IP023_13465 [Sphingobacterium rhinopitheci]|nr:hypothetical protein [Sphingobacterium rhinopitheci]
MKYIKKKKYYKPVIISYSIEMENSIAVITKEINCIKLVDTCDNDTGDVENDAILEGWC